MSKNSVINDIIHVMSSNILLLMGSVVTGIFLPLILGATNYGYYRLFILYTSYTALLHFGFVDGIVLKDSGKDLNTLNKYKYRSNSIIFIIFQLIISLVIILPSIFISNKIVSFLFLSVGISTFLVNITTYYRYVSQATMQFSQLSIRNSIQAVLVIVLTISVWVLYKFHIIITISYSDYTNIMLFIYFIMFLIYIVSYRSITFGKHDSLRRGISRVIKYCKAGIYLTIAYQISNLILIIDNQIVSMFFKASTYGIYSFSYSITHTAITILGAVAVVLLPHLKSDNFNHMISIYHKMVSSMMLVVYLGLLAYFPLCVLVKIILPEYTQSLSYLKIFLPELGITCSVTMITFNYYNALGKSKFYFYMSLVILAISAVIDSVMYMLFHDPVLVAFGSFIAIFIWYLASEYFLVKWYHVQWLKNLIYMMIMIGSFFVASMVPNLIIGFGAYLIAYAIVSWIMFRKIIEKNVIIILNKI